MQINRRSRGSGGTLEMNMTPMIDVVFLLMIYFMTTLNATSISKEQMELPLQPGSQDQSESALTINIDRSGRIIVTGEELTLPELITVVSQEIARVGNNPDQVKVVLRADRSGESRVVNQVVSRLLAMGIKQISFGTEDSQ